ncbi:hypothetical protein PN462_03970 [Spirulina sp. CS-785/01]|uniref:hypothetical protein n=1 Tax=Spirulina sp. CS-785/01 TaxID=3021716 RepID=UPI00232A8B13|nr:hypothetical protein [Spirulina sp. CS-785/01]MDB9312249.1 hypothetical protein [Spirulina sp. CS-785/01]
MTQLINLESYLNCYQYAALFREDAKTLTPPSKKNVLPLAYQDFCKRYSEQKISPFPVILSQQPNQLTPRHQPLPKSPLGLTLEDEQNEQIFIVRESNTFALRSLQSRYLFTNVYYYWKYASQLQELAQSEKPLVIYNLNCFTPPQIIPLTFEARPHAPYLIPIIDLRNINNLELNLSLSYEVIYDKICFDLANLIRSKISLEASPKTVADYLKNINFFNYIPQHYNHQTFSLIIKLDNTFYTCPLTLQEIQQITEKNLPLDQLNQIAYQYSHYNFVFLSPYNNFPRIKQHLNNLLLPQISHNEFPKIWQHKQKNSFPLYGQHLDQISFFVKRNNQTIEISLPSEICYEGEQEKVLYAQYRDSQQQLQETFSISTSFVELPFTINGEPFQEEEIEQIYKIENPYFEETPNLDIKIRFRLQPGLMPKLEVLDQKNRILNSSLVDKVEQQLGFIPIQTIQEFRTKKSQEVLEKLQDPQNPLKKEFVQSLKQLSQFLKQVLESHSITLKNLEKINEYRTEVRKVLTIKKSDQFMILQPSSYSLGSVTQDIIQLFQQIQEKSNRQLRINDKLTNDKKIKLQLFKNKKINSYLDGLFLLLGKSYALTHSSDLTFFFDNQEINLLSSQTYWQNLARMSSSSDKKKQYFNNFDQPNFQCYLNSDYMWGYARILMWYLNFQDDRNCLDYQRHFHLLIKNSLQTSDDKYLQDALFALIYLITFREIDKDFVKIGSEDYHLAKELCKQLKDKPIYSKKANLGGTALNLNECFQNLLDGKATEEQVKMMIEID